MKTREHLNTFAGKQQNIKKYLSKLAPLAFFYILLYHVEAVKKFCKAVVLYLIETITDIGGKHNKFIFYRGKDLPIRDYFDGSIGNINVGSSWAE